MFSAAPMVSVGAVPPEGVAALNRLVQGEPAPFELTQLERMSARVKSSVVGAVPLAGNQGQGR